MAEPTLKSGLTLRFIVAALLLLLLDGIACYFTAAHFANLVYDRWLIDSTRSLAQALRTDGGEVRFTLPQIALQIFQFDESDRTVFRVDSERRGLIAGDASLPLILPRPDGEVRLATVGVQGHPMRLVSMQQLEPEAHDAATVEVGETLKKRATLFTGILLAMAAPQLALIAAALLVGWIAAGHGLKPLTGLAAAIEARSYENLTPLPELGLPKEAWVLASRINDLLGRLEQALTAQRRFVADAAHQLRTPLATVLLYSERAEQAVNSHDPESARTALHGLHAAVARAARLSQQLLALTRAEPGAAQHAMSPLDLVGLAREVGEEWIPRALEKRIDFGFMAPEAPVIVSGNAGLLGEMMSNLIDNALRYCGPASRVTLSVSAIPLPSVAVEDDGPGVPEPERERIFERFYRVAGTEANGCGLGLAIVREIATLHRAVARVETGSGGRGARFTVQFQRSA
ncbi:MAG TPA: sensor histidine kinase N-terminal domain-containing protein [Steroidobacteraceae bacterium]|nr:sensor histidine kinase N-terminal domain-containing protein [Steroidobacteraceae bacterium]